MCGGSAGGKDSARRGRIFPRVSEEHGAQSQFVKDPQEIEVVPQRFGTFHRQEQRDPAVRLGLLNFSKCFAKDEARSGFQLRLEQRNLIQCHL